MTVLASPESSNGVVTGPSGHRRRVQTTRQAMANMLKSAVGPGCLALAAACSRTGIWTGGSVMLALQICCTYDMVLLVRLKQHFQGEGARTYSDLATRILGDGFRRIVEICTSLQQLGVCSVYFAFIASGLETALLNLGLDLDHFGLSRSRLMLLSFLVLCPLSLIRHWHKLAPLAIVANIFIFSGIGIALGCTVHVLLAGGGPAPPSPVPSTAGSDLSAVMLLFGTVAYSFELVCNVLPIENTMEEPSKAKPVVLTCMVVYCALMQVLGLLPVAAFGEISRGSLVDELGRRLRHSDSMPLIVCANGLIIACVVLTYPVQIYPVTEIVERAFGVGAGAGASARSLEQSLAATSVGLVSPPSSSSSASSPNGSPQQRLPPCAASGGGGGNGAGSFSGRGGGGVSKLRGALLAEEAPGPCLHPPVALPSGPASPAPSSSSPCGGRSHRSVTALRLALRASCVAGTMLVALAVPDVGQLVSLFGSAAAPMLSMILPPLMALKAPGFPQEVPCFPKLSARPLHALLVAVGVLGAFAGTAASIRQILGR